MSQHSVRHVWAVALLFAGSTAAFAQRTELDQLKKPQSVAQYWAAIKLEINLGKFDTAAEYLKGMLALNPTDKDLLAIEEKEGIVAFLALNDIPKWSNNKQVDIDAKNNVKTLISKVTAAVKALRSDPERIRKYIRNLGASPEEREYALAELKKSGAAAMPQLIGTLQHADLQERAVILGVLPKLDQETVPALLAAFDINNPTLRIEFMNVLQHRSDILELLNNTLTDPRPTLWHLSVGNDLVAQKAKSLIGALTGIPSNRMPHASVELTKAAENIYQHKSTLNKEPEVVLWRYDGQLLGSSRWSASQAEEYYGLRFARWAIQADPNFEAAKVLFLSLALEKAFERAGLDAKLSKSAPIVHELLAVASGSILYSILDKALKENHLPVAMGVCQIIGERVESQGVKGSLDGLVKALNSKDRRLALAAADALIRMPGTTAQQMSSRIVEVYRSALAGTPAGDGAAYRPKALIADPDQGRAELFSDTIRQAGFDPVVTRTGRDTLRRLNEASDIDVLWINHELPYPQLPEFLAQVRGDYRYGRLPLFVTMSEDVSKFRLPEMEVRLGLIERQFGADLRGNKKLTIDLNKMPLRLTLKYDAYQLVNREQAAMDEWLATLAKERPTIRQTIRAKLVIRVTITDKDEPGLEPRLQELTEGLQQVKVVRDPVTLLTLEMDGLVKQPDELVTRLTALDRDFGAAKNKVVRISRELPTWIILSNVDAPPPLVPRAPKTFGPDDKGDEDYVTRIGHENVKEDRTAIARNTMPELEARLARIVETYQNIQVILQPTLPEDIGDALKQLQKTAGPMIAPLSEAERKDHQKRAIEALRQMATGVIQGFDVRPAATEIIAATRSDDLAPAAIEATGRLGNKEAQQALADVILTGNRPVAIRRQAAEELVKHLRRFGAAHIADSQIAGLIKLLDDEKSLEVKVGAFLALGALPRERVMKNFTTQEARDKWVNKLLNYVPQPPAPPAPPTAPPKSEGM